jgi:hypothetical protein
MPGRGPDCWRCGRQVLKRVGAEQVATVEQGDESPNQQPPILAGQARLALLRASKCRPAV